jgi:UDP-GlcNAc:undecaprenyl-phosphate/decaprenyl-phosphate GlcNAc-1-phosphate transferase
MISIVGSAITAFVVSVFIFPILIKYSHKKKIWDEPSHRRINKRVIPSIGGVAIFFGFATSTLIWVDVLKWHDFKVILGILFITFILGLCDDLVHIKPSVKLLGQTIAGSLAFFLLDIRLSSFYGLMDGSFNPLVSYFITIFTIIILTNSFNLIDGIDGLAGTFASVALLFFGSWFLLVGDVNYSILCFSLAGAIVAFLIFNWEPSRILMGDTGALLIGMMLSITVIGFINRNSSLPSDADYKFNAPIAVSICVMIISIVDTVRVIIIRVSKGMSPLVADKRHIHHALVRVGLRHKQCVLLLAGIHLTFIAAALVFRPLPELPFLIGVVLFSTLLSGLLHYVVKSRI